MGFPPRVSRLGVRGCIGMPYLGTRCWVCIQTSRNKSPRTSTVQNRTVHFERLRAEMHSNPVPLETDRTSSTLNSTLVNHAFLFSWFSFGLKRTHENIENFLMLDNGKGNCTGFGVVFWFQLDSAECNTVGSGSPRTSAFDAHLDFYFINPQKWSRAPKREGFSFVMM